MTDALCLNCGEIKFGAICPCPKCQSGSTGDMNLDIAFSDHRFARQTLEELGAVIATIHTSSDDDQLCLWSFINYISTNHPEILRVKLEPDAKKKCERLLESLDLPSVTIRPSPRAQMLKEAAKQAGSGKNKRWWQFWS